MPLPHGRGERLPLQPGHSPPHRPCSRGLWTGEWQAGQEAEVPRGLPIHHRTDGNPEARRPRHWPRVTWLTVLPAPGQPSYSCLVLYPPLGRRGGGGHRWLVPSAQSSYSICHLNGAPHLSALSVGPCRSSQSGAPLQDGDLGGGRSSRGGEREAPCTAGGIGQVRREWLGPCTDDALEGLGREPRPITSACLGCGR